MSDKDQGQANTDFWDRLESGKYKLESNDEYLKRTEPRHDHLDCPCRLLKIKKCDCYAAKTA